MVSDAGFTVAGLFAGIGGIERGLARAGGHAELLCECWEPAKAVLLRIGTSTNCVTTSPNGSTKPVT